MLISRFADPRHAAAALALVILTSASAFAQRTDVAALANGDRITGEVRRLDRGRLEFKTDDAGTLYLEWDALVSVVTTRTVEVVSEDGTRRVGSLVPAPEGFLVVSAPGAADSFPMAVVTHIAPVGRGFWRQLEGSIDAGFSYSRSSGVAQLNVNSSTVYRRPAFKARLTATLTYTEKDDGSGRDDRGSVELGYRRFRWPRAFVGALARFETNESVGLELRSLVAAARFAAEADEPLQPGWIVMLGGATAAEPLGANTWVECEVQHLGRCGFSVTP